MRILRKKSSPRLLGVVLCYNDGDFLRESVEALIEQGHDVIAWDHGSTDETPQILNDLRSELVEVKRIPREFDFYNLYQAMSEHLLSDYVERYDWISWPDQDEILEGADRSKSYAQWVAEVLDSPYDWVQFRNMNYWWTREDDPEVSSVITRIRHYSRFGDCAPRIRAWRSHSTNIREFNHNPPFGKQYPQMFNLRHYPMRSEEQMIRRIQKDRAGLRRGTANFHYENLGAHIERLTIDSSRLHSDDGGELSQEEIFNWRDLYGTASDVGAS